MTQPLSTAKMLAALRDRDIDISRQNLHKNIVPTLIDVGLARSLGGNDRNTILFSPEAPAALAKYMKWREGCGFGGGIKHGPSLFAASQEEGVE